MFNKSLFTVLAVSGLVLAAPAFAEHDEIEAFKAAKVTIHQAIDSAEKATAGKAISAELNDNGEDYEVTVVKGEEVWDVEVNALDGSIIKSEKDKD